MSDSGEWLAVDGQRVAPLLIADGFWAKAKGLLGRSEFDGALLIKSTSSVHTFGMRFAIDVAFCDHSLRVLQVASLHPNRIAPVVAGTQHVLEAQAGAFATWRVAVASQLTMQT